MEGTAWTYAFFVPHDMEGLIGLHGESSFVEQLQWMFESGRFVMWNEPDMAYPYLFTFIDGEASRTQIQVRSAMDRYFGTGADGLPGNDDAGALSAWFVFSALGFYPVTPGRAEYRVGSPLFERVAIHLDDPRYSGETFVIEAEGNAPDHVLIEQMTLNGKQLLRPALSHQDITAGGVLRLRMAGSSN